MKLFRPFWSHFWLPARRRRARTLAVVDRLMKLRPQINLATVENRLLGGIDTLDQLEKLVERIEEVDAWVHALTPMVVMDEISTGEPTP